MAALSKSYNLFKVNPDVAGEWHPKKNGRLTPKDVVPGSGKKVWWKCKKGHEWQAIIRKRSAGGGCPFCSNKRVCKDNCLATLNRNLALEWHPTRNNGLTPEDVVANSNKKVWWICRLGHQWKAHIYMRSSYYIKNRKGTGCPYCAHLNLRTKKRVDTRLKHNRPGRL